MICKVSAGPGSWRKAMQPVPAVQLRSAGSRSGNTSAVSCGERRTCPAYRRHRRPEEQPLFRNAPRTANGTPFVNAHGAECDHTHEKQIACQKIGDPWCHVTASAGLLLRPAQLAGQGGLNRLQNRLVRGEDDAGLAVVLGGEVGIVLALAGVVGTEHQRAGIVVGNVVR